MHCLTSQPQAAAPRAPAAGAGAAARRCSSLSARASVGAAPVRLQRSQLARGGRATALRAVAEEAAPRVGSDPSTISPALPAVMNIDQIMAALPHRFPFLLVDRVVEYVPGKYAIGIKNVTINDNFFPGHFPTRPLMPGVLQVEAMAQVGGLVMLTDDVGGSKDNFFFGGVDGCKFRRPVLPGDTLVMRVDLVKLQKRFGVAKMRAEAYVGKDLACEADLTMFLGKA